VFHVLAVQVSFAVISPMKQWYYTIDFMFLRRFPRRESGTTSFPVARQALVDPLGLPFK
jgi:hypothetical protein